MRGLGSDRISSSTDRASLPDTHHCDCRALPSRVNAETALSRTSEERPPTRGGRPLSKRDRPDAPFHHRVNLILALDQGTSGSAALLFDDSGAVRASADREIAQHYPASGHVEHDAEEIFATTVAVARE